MNWQLPAQTVKTLPNQGFQIILPNKPESSIMSELQLGQLKDLTHVHNGRKTDIMTAVKSLNQATIPSKPHDT